MLNKDQKHFIATHAPGEPRIVHGGHMLYTRAIVDHQDHPWFIKAHDSSLFTHRHKRDEALRYLRKEYDVYSYLKDQGFIHLPDRHHYDHGVLLLSALPESYGWHWEVPKNSTTRYIQDVLNTLGNLNSLPSTRFFDTEPSLEHFWISGWGTGLCTRTSIDVFINAYKDSLLPPTLKNLTNLHRDLPHIKLTNALPSSATISHYDLRQSNIAWHPDSGVKIIDWSWASHGHDKADSTMFLIDLHKSFVDVTPYLADHFNSDFARLMIGYWLLRAGQPSAKGNDIVRYHQLVSAVSAYELLTLNRR